MTVVLSPCPPRRETSSDGGPPAGDLRGLRIGVRLDRFWQSWNWMTDEWVQALVAEGAFPVVWRAPIAKGEEPAAEASAEFEAFAGAIDAAIIGLCNCGSCSLWAVHDCLALLDRGLPVVLVATAQFEQFAQALCAQGGRTEVRLQVVPYPLEGRLEDDVRDVARAHYEPMLRTFGATR